MRARAAHGHRRLLIHGGSHEISPRPAVTSITKQYPPAVPSPQRRRNRRRPDRQAPSKPAASAFPQLSRNKGASLPIPVHRIGLIRLLDLTHIKDAIRGSVENDQETIVSGTQIAVAIASWSEQMTG
jgi:hypothetical protein